MQLFQFQSGAVKMEGALQDIDGTLRFNSKVVRLKFFIDITRSKRKTGFNSKVVRLKCSNTAHRCRATSVSIPKWCG